MLSYPLRICGYVHKMRGFWQIFPKERFQGKALTLLVSAKSIAGSFVPSQGFASYWSHAYNYLALLHYCMGYNLWKRHIYYIRIEGHIHKMREGILQTFPKGRTLLVSEKSIAGSFALSQGFASYSSRAYNHLAIPTTTPIPRPTFKYIIWYKMHSCTDFLQLMHMLNIVKES